MSTENQNSEVVDDKLEIEVVDDTPAEDKGRKPLKAEPAPVTDDELENYSDKVKGRISELTRARHDERRKAEAAVRERDEAIRVAKALLADREEITKRLRNGETAYAQTLQNAATQTVEQARAKVKAAYESGDPDQIVAATEALADAKLTSEKVKNFRPSALQPGADVVKLAQTQPSVAPKQQVEVDPKAKDWAEQNKWFGQDMEMTALAYGIDEDLRANGVDPKSDDYYAKLNSRLRQRFPEKFEQSSDEPRSQSRPPATVVAPGTRSAAPRRVVITESARRIAERMGVPLELYAKEYAKMEKQNGR